MVKIDGVLRSISSGHGWVVIDNGLAARRRSVELGSLVLGERALQKLVPAARTADYVAFSRRSAGI